MLGRSAGVAAFTFLLSQAGGAASSASRSGIDEGTAAIVCALIAGIVAVTVAVIQRPSKKGSEDDELVKLAALISLTRHAADHDGDDDLKAEQGELSKHVTEEMAKELKANRDELARRVEAAKRRPRGRRGQG